MANGTKKTGAQTWSSVLDMPLDELESRVGQASTLIKQALDLFPGLLVLTDEERRYSNGRFRNGEGKMYLTIQAPHRATSAPERATSALQ